MMMLSEAAKALGAKLTGPDCQFEAVSTDTRNIQAGSLFVALKGERFDGHDYIQLAKQQGAVGVICDRDLDADIAYIKVHDTRMALGELAAYWRQKLKITVVGLTGSNGKTTVKEMLTAILSEVAEVASTRGNFNNDIGLPLTLLEMRGNHRYAVIEMGANHAGEIEYLTHLTKPDVAILNNAGPAHLEGFGSLQGVAQAKGEIFSGLTANGVAIINVDDEFADYWISLCDDHKKIFFGLDESAMITTSSELRSYQGEFILETPDGSIEISLPVPGLHNLKNALAASAAAIALNIDLETIKKGLEKFSGVKGRLQFYRGFSDALVIDDSYNANPMSFRVAIDVLATQQKTKILVLGDMGELGADAAELHFKTGEYAKQKGIDYLLATGKLGEYAAEGFGDHGQFYKNKSDLITDVKLQMNEGVAVLVKGSRSMHMEEVVTALTNNNDNSGASSCC